MIYVEAEVNGRIRKLAFEPVEDGLRVLVDGREHRVEAAAFDGFFYSILIGHLSFEVTVEENEEGFRVQMGADAVQVNRVDPLRPTRSAGGRGGGGHRRIRAAMPGKVVRVAVKAGDVVEAGQALLVLEAMKMENEVQAPSAGRVTAVLVQEGNAVEGGADLVTLEE